MIFTFLSLSPHIFNIDKWGQGNGVLRKGKENQMRDTFFSKYFYQITKTQQGK